jgi:hypothetical protein
VKISLLHCRIVFVESCYICFKKRKASRKEVKYKILNVDKELSLRMR